MLFYVIWYILFYDIHLFIFNKIIDMIFNKTALNIAVEKENEKIVQLLLSVPNINVNDRNISINRLLIKFQKFTNLIQFQSKLQI